MREKEHVIRKIMLCCGVGLQMNIRDDRIESNDPSVLVLPRTRAALCQNNLDQCHK